MSDADALVARYAGIVCDLDGVVYRGPDRIAHAVETLAGIDVPVIYATNNASRTPTQVAEHLTQLGLDVAGDAVVTSSTAAAGVLAEDLAPGSEVLVVGGEGVGQAVAAQGLRPLTPEDHAGGGRRPAAVLQGYGPDVRASDLAEAAYAVASGARWVATNDDRTLPTDRGVAPGNGALVAAVELAVGAPPEVVGKPHPPVYALAAKVMGVASADVLAIGDRLETDIAGATATGMDGLLVLTGVHGWIDAARAPEEQRPRYVVEDLRGLLRSYPDPGVDGGWSTRGDARARVVDGQLEVDGAPSSDAARASLDALWSAVDAGDLLAEDAATQMAAIRGLVDHGG